MTTLLGTLAAADEATKRHALQVYSRLMDELTSKEAIEGMLLAVELSALHSMPLSETTPAVLDLRAQLWYGFPNYPLPPLPPEHDTRERQGNNALRHFILHPLPTLLMYQLKIDELLRNNQVWEPFEFIMLLNYIHQHRTSNREREGGFRFLLPPDMCIPKHELDTFLLNLQKSKPETLHNLSSFSLARHDRMVRTTTASALCARSFSSRRQVAYPQASHSCPTFRRYTRTTARRRSKSQQRRLARSSE